MNTMQDLMSAIRESERVAVFSGAGVSTLCGIPDFRGPNGLYRDPNMARMFDIDLFDRDPSFFYRYADGLVYNTETIHPGAVHLAVKRLQDVGKCAGVITQNIDCLHERAGSDPVFAVHGSAVLHHCRTCDDKKTFDEIVALRAGTKGGVPRCAKCGGVYKPDITFFGEALPEEAFYGAMRLAQETDLMLVLGSSLTVSPANSIPPLTVRAGGRMVIINAQPTGLDGMAEATFPDLKEFADAVMEAFPAP
ncbi:MAG: NAD-dependent deacetylase [Kiritimatiellae bacterium]|nr:NAD-dependent deacetylase [Kiritimatiellia bacterium]